jgi:hypothetical protein
LGKIGGGGRSIGFAEEQMPLGYSLAPDDSIWIEPPVSDSDKRPKPPIKVCNSFIRIAEIQENIDTGQISVVVEYKYLGKLRTTTIQRSQMNDSRQLVAALAGEGAPISSNNARLVLSYLTAYEHSFGETIPRKKVTSRFGRGRETGTFSSRVFPLISNLPHPAPATWPSTVPTPRAAARSKVGSRSPMPLRAKHS